ncbi:MAG: lipoate--protein ligase family protein [Chloroflexi bacterium]|nr:lipoate--protein ligase family protein [Chloroflexota bacterium]
MRRTSAPWRFLKLAVADGPWNMAVDEAIMTLVGRGQAPKTLRFYAWSPACLSIGYFQSVSKDIDIEACAAQGVTLVRRPTGGRAVLHDQELTCSVVALETDDSVSGGIADSFKKISSGLVEGFRRLGLAVRIGPGRPASKAAFRTPACFDATSQHEVTFRGRKLVGSAQCRKGGVFLQQGSIPLFLDSERLFSLFKAQSDVARRRFADHVLPLGEALCGVELDDVASALRAGFEKALGPVIEGALAPQEARLAEHLVASKYRVPDWNLKR